MENILSEMDKDESPTKRTGTLNMEIKTNPIHPPKKEMKRAGIKQILLP